MKDVVVLVPVLKRPHRVDPLIESFYASTDRARLIFLASPTDLDEQRAINAAYAEMLVVNWPSGSGDYAKKMNYGATMTEEPWIFLGADDLHFHPGWVEAAIDVYDKGVIGTNDLGNPRVKAGTHSTHSFVRRDYMVKHGTIDKPGQILHTGYHHNWVDNELVETARRRQEWAFAKDSHVEHLHPSWKKGDYDETYRLGHATFRIDRAYFTSRRHLWMR